MTLSAKMTLYQSKTQMLEYKKCTYYTKDVLKNVKQRIVFKSCFTIVSASPHISKNA